jgi:hypothetical protein
MFEDIELQVLSPEVTELILRISLDERKKIIAHLYTR